MSEDDALDDISRFQSSTRIRIELATPLHLEFEGISTRASGIMVGMEVDRYLILKLTGSVDAVASKLFKGNGVVVRYIYEGTVYAFQCRSLGSVATPARLLFVTYPTIVAEKVIRQRHRVLCRLPVTLQVAGREAAGLLLDVNNTGGRLSFTPPPAADGEEPMLPDADDVVGLVVRLPGSTDALEIAGSVRNRRLDSHGCQLGIAFEPLEEAASDAITAFMQEMDAAD